jgi:hypothetical protein
MEGNAMHDTAPRLIGQLEGRVVALEDRMDRNEITAAARLETIEMKLDRLASTLSQGMGGLQLAHWIGGALLAALGFFASHLWPGKNG